jgi:hypothetical protein
VAEFVGLVLCCQGFPTSVGIRFKSRNLIDISEIPQEAAAVLAAHILKIQKLATALAAEQFHGRMSPPLQSRKRPPFEGVPARTGQRNGC